MLYASCHCGAVRIEISRRPRSLTECTCSICRRYGAQWAYLTHKTARVDCAADALSRYLWGKQTLEFYFCNRCGCLTYYESVDKRAESRIAVNARMMDPEEIRELPVKLFDGASSWKYIERQ